MTTRNKNQMRERFEFIKEELKKWKEINLEEVEISNYKYELLEKMKPIMYGGGMNKNYNKTNLLLMDIPYRFEAGTQDIANIIGFSETIKYLKNILIYLQVNIEKIMPVCKKRNFR